MTGQKETPEGVARRLTQASRTSSVHVFDDAHIDVEKEYTMSTKLTQWYRKQAAGFRHQADTYTVRDWLGTFLPCLSWLIGYDPRSSLLMDAVAGVSIGFMVVPQGMSYALLAGLPPQFGLYGAFVPVFVYALFGSSRHLAVGPVAVTSLLLGQSLNGIFPASKEILDPANPGDLADVQADYNQAAIQISFLVGVLYLAVGTFRLGFLANFLSHSVISGFTTGAALIIGLSQLKYVFGVSIKSTHTALETLIEIIHELGNTNWREVVMSVVWLAILLAVKKVSKRYPKLGWLRPLGPITVVIIAILVVVIGGLDDDSGRVRVVGNVPDGLPDVTVGDWLPLFDTGRQLSTSFILFLVGFMESISISKALARKHDYQISVTQEIISMGFANLVGGMFSAYPTTGSFSRSAVAADIGAKTPLQGVITGTVVLLVLQFITPVFEKLPFNAMGAIVLSSVLGLFELSEARFLFKANFLDFMVWLAAFLGTVFLGVEIGLGIAIGLAILLVVYQSAFPHTAVLGRLPETQVYRNVKQYQSAIQDPHVAVVRVDAPIYFANVEWIRGRIDKYKARANADAALGPVHFIILDMAPVPFVDSTGLHALQELVTQLKREGIRLSLANPSKKVQAQLMRTKVLEEIGHEWVFVRTVDAVKMCSMAVRDAQAGNGLKTVTVRSDVHPEPGPKAVESSSSGRASSDIAAEALARSPASDEEVIAQTAAATAAAAPPTPADASVPRAAEPYEGPPPPQSQGDAFYTPRGAIQ